MPRTGEARMAALGQGTIAFAPARSGAHEWTRRKPNARRSREAKTFNLRHELVQLAARVYWDWIDREVEALYSDNGRPGIEMRFVIGLLPLKHIYGLSDKGACERWVYDPYFQHFTGEEFFQHEFPHGRSDLSHWRKRLGSA